MDTILTVEKQIKEGHFSSNPHGVAETRVLLAGEYSFYSGILEDILTRKPKVWNSMRSNHKSDTATEREWEATEDGINETVIRLKLKRIEKLISALSTLLRVAEGQSKNQF